MSTVLQCSFRSNQLFVYKQCHLQTEKLHMQNLTIFGDLLGGIQSTISQLSGSHWLTMTRFFLMIYRNEHSCRFIKISHWFVARIQMPPNPVNIKNCLIVTFRSPRHGDAYVYKWMIASFCMRWVRNHMYHTPVRTDKYRYVTQPHTVYTSYKSLLEWGNVCLVISDILD